MFSSFLPQVLRRTLSFALIFLVTGPAAATSAESEATNVLTLGGDPYRSHHYQSEIGAILCRQSVLSEVGKTLSQPLTIHYPQDTSGSGHTVVYHLGRNDLFKISPDGTVLARVRVQEVYSWGHITYSIASPEGVPDPTRDVLYVTLGPSGIGTKDPGMAAYRPSTLEKLGEWRTDDADGIASAPLDMGGDRIVFGVVPGRIYVLRGLAENRPRPSVLPKGGWNSGTALRIGENSFAIAVEPGVYAYSLAEEKPWQDFAQIWSYRLPGGAGLSQVAGDGSDVTSSSPQTYPDWLYLSTKDSYFIKLSKTTGHPQEIWQLDRRGFINTGLAVTGQGVTFGMRWLDSDGTRPGTAEGAIVTIDPAWTKPPALKLITDIQPHGRSWVNVDPIAWSPPGSSGSRPTVFIGDAGAAVTAWRDGQQHKVFLTDPRALNGWAPVDCATVESTDPGYEPAFRYSHRVVLTGSPRLTYGAEAWYNTQGTATGMAVSDGRLYTGYIGPDNESGALVIFRTAASLSIPEEPSVEVEGADGTWSAVRKETRLLSGQKVRVTVPLRLDGDAESAAVPVPLLIGWTGQKPRLEIVEMAPFQAPAAGAGTFVLEVPADTGAPELMVVANPWLYGARYDQERSRGVLPPGVRAEALPARLPEPWVRALTELGAQISASGIQDRFGEVWVLDNAWSRKFRGVCGNLRPELAVPSDTPKSGFPVTVRVRRQGCEQERSVTLSLNINGWERMATAEFRGDTASAPFQTGPLLAGDKLNLVAKADPVQAIPESNEADNEVRGYVEMRSGSASRSCPAGVAPHNCFQTQVQSDATHTLKP